MSDNQSYDIFFKGKDLKFAPFWKRLEEFLADPMYLVNIGELLEKASEEIFTRLAGSFQCFMDIDVAFNLCTEIHEVVIVTAVSSKEMSDDELYKICENRSHDIITKSRCLSYEDINKYRHLGTFLSDYLKSFMRLKKGSDVFSDLLFSDSVITDKLEDRSNITALLSFISALGPNVFLKTESNN